MGAQASFSRDEGCRIPRSRLGDRYWKLDAWCVEGGLGGWQAAGGWGVGQEVGAGRRGPRESQAGEGVIFSGNCSFSGEGAKDTHVPCHKLTRVYTFHACVNMDALGWHLLSRTTCLFHVLWLWTFLPHCFFPYPL